MYNIVDHSIPQVQVQHALFSQALFTPDISVSLQDFQTWSCSNVNVFLASKYCTETALTGRL